MHDPVSSDSSSALTKLDDVLAVARSIEAEISRLAATLQGRTKPLLTVEEVADLVGRAPFTVRRWIAAKRIDAIRVEGTGPRGRLLVSREQLHKVIKNGQGGELEGVL